MSRQIGWQICARELAQAQARIAVLEAALNEMVVIYQGVPGHENIAVVRARAALAAQEAGDE